MYLYFSTGNGQPREPALCQLCRHTFVSYRRDTARVGGFVCGCEMMLVFCLPQPGDSAGIFQTSVVARRPGFYAPAVESRRRSLSLSMYSVPARLDGYDTVQPLALRQVVVAAP